MYLYSALFVARHSRCGQAWITQCYLQITPYLPLPRKRSSDGATTDWWWHTSNCSLLLIYWPRKDERLSWPSWLQCSGWFTYVSGHSSSVSSTEQGRFAGQRPTFYNCATQPTLNGDGGCRLWQPVHAGSQPKSSGLVLGWRPLWRRSTFIKWTGWTLAMALPWWQHHKYCLGIIIIFLGAFIIIIFFILLLLLLVVVVVFTIIVGSCNNWFLHP